MMATALSEDCAIHGAGSGSTVMVPQERGELRADLSTFVGTIGGNTTPLLAHDDHETAMEGSFAFPMCRAGDRATRRAVGPSQKDGGGELGVLSEALGGRQVPASQEESLVDILTVHNSHTPIATLLRHRLATPPGSGHPVPSATMLRSVGHVRDDFQSSWQPQHATTGWSDTTPILSLSPGRAEGRMSHARSHPLAVEEQEMVSIARSPPAAATGGEGRLSSTSAPVGSPILSRSALGTHNQEQRGGCEDEEQQVMLTRLASMNTKHALSCAAVLDQLARLEQKLPEMASGIVAALRTSTRLHEEEENHRESDATVITSTAPPSSQEPLALRKLQRKGRGLPIPFAAHRGPVEASSQETTVATSDRFPSTRDGKRDHLHRFSQRKIISRIVWFQLLSFIFSTLRHRLAGLLWRALELCE